MQLEAEFVGDPCAFGTTSGDGEGTSEALVQSISRILDGLTEADDGTVTKVDLDGILAVTEQGCLYGQDGTIGQVEGAS